MAALGPSLKARTPALVSLAYFAIVAALFLPIFLTLSTHAVGDRYNDVWQAIWGTWWVKEHLGQVLTFDTFTRLSFYPEGIDLHTHTPVYLAQFYALPFLLVASPVVAWNLTIYVVLSLNCVSMYVLARHLVKDEFASFVAGLLFGINAYVLGHLHNGSPDHIALFFIPLSILALVRLVEAPGVKTAVATSLLLLLTYLSSWYYGFYVGLFALLYVGVAVLQRRGGERRRLLGFGGGAALLYSALVLPFLIPLVRNTALARPADVIAMSQLHFIIDVSAFFVPGKPVMNPELRHYLKPVYLGAVCLALCGFSLTRPRRPQALVFGGLALAFLVVTLGSHLSIFGRIFHGVPLPSRLLPIFGTYRAHGVNLALFGILGGFGAAALMGRVPGRGVRRTLQVALPVAILAEVLLLSPGPYPAPRTDATVPAAYEILAADDEPYGIIDVPFELDNHFFCGRYQFYQTVHRKYLVAGVTYFLPSEASGTNWDYIKDNPALGKLITLPGDRDRPRTGVDDARMEEAFRQLEEDGFRYIVVHRRYLPPGRLAGIDGLLARFLGPDARRTEDGIDLWHL